MRLSLIWVGASLLAGYIGAERCKLCHRQVYESWRRTVHASGTTVGVETGSPCQSCHSSDEARLPGVQCEACHGAGSDYWPAEVMIDPDKASMAGLVRPTEATCRRCHSPERAAPGHVEAFVMPNDDEWVNVVHSRKKP